MCHDKGYHMSMNASGASPIDRLATHYESDPSCPKCGYEERERMTVRTSGKEVRYTRRCSSCGAESSRRLQLK